jgi:hypothetical protein
MHSRLSFFMAALLISTGPSGALSKPDPAASRFTLQVASFPDTAQANRFAAGLVLAGEKPLFDTVEIEGRGFWTRVFVGLFDTSDTARRYGGTLLARGTIKEFLVKKADPILAFTRPRRVASSESQVPKYTGSSGLSPKSKLAVLDTSTGSGSAVWVVENGRATSRAVEVGPARGEQVEVRKGLSGGESVIRSAPGNLKEGDRVRIKGA